MATTFEGEGESSEGPASPYTRTQPPKKKQRVSRACDSCHKRRVKCDGNHPCSRCADLSVCTFLRGTRKRGKPPRDRQVRDRSSSTPSTSEDIDLLDQDALPDLEFPCRAQRIADSARDSLDRHHRQVNREEIPGLDMFESIRYDRSVVSPPKEQQLGMIETDILSFGRPDIGFENALRDPLVSERLRFLSSAYMNQNLPDWASIRPDTADATLSTDQESQIPHSFRYPVLKPLLPYIESFLTGQEACSLLETYFSSSFDDVLHPACRHIHAFVFRRSSVLGSKSPRPCSDALLTSMLCIAAETGCDEMLTWSHRRRQMVSSKLYALTVQLLRPLVHVDYPEAFREEVVTLGVRPRAKGLGTKSQHNLVDHETLLHEQGTIDDVVTYMHIATVASASERKAASMRWWHAAFTLARELKLNVEPSTEAFMFSQKDVTSASRNAADPWAEWDSFDFEAFTTDYTDTACRSPPLKLSGQQHDLLGEEQQEERRRIWWLLYIQDRHLALCYNRHLALTDAECSELLLPLDEAAWQTGSFLTGADRWTERPGFPSFKCTGHTVFGFLLPLACIIGEILDHNHGKQHPFLGEQYRMAPHAQAIEAQITQQLVTYKESLDEFQFHQAPGNAYLNNDSQQRTLHTRTVVEYANFVIHICYVLLAGKCDPVSMFEDKDSWMLSQDFVATKDHAVEAAEALSQILDLDPDLSFMPYFMGILLLQGSFVLLLVIDRLHEQTEPQIVSACETVIRAIEACVATMDAEYERKYRQILCSAVMQAQGRKVPAKISQYRRRAVLALYRWTRSGTGLAL